MISNVSSADSHKSENVGDCPKPPSRHWALALLFHSLTGIYGFVLSFRQAVWIRHIDPTSNAVFLLVMSFALAVIMMVGGDEAPMRLLRPLLYVGSFMAWAWAYFSMRRAIEDRFELSLSRVMTLFFSFLYLQYHMRRIAKGEYAVRGDPSIRLRSVSGQP